MITISSDLYGPLYFRGTSKDFTIKYGYAAASNENNGYFLQQSNNGPIQKLGFGIYLYTTGPGPEVYLKHPPETVLMTLERINSMFKSMYNVRDNLLSTVHYTEALKATYKDGIRDMVTNMVVVYDPYCIA